MHLTVIDSSLTLGEIFTPYVLLGLGAMIVGGLIVGIASGPSKKSQIGFGLFGAVLIVVGTTWVVAASGLGAWLQPLSGGL